MTQLENTRRAGSKIRAKYISDSKKKVESLSSELTSLIAQLADAKEKEARLKSALDRAESADKETIDRKKATREHSSDSSLASETSFQD